MVNLIITSIFAVWVAVSIFRGYKRGFLVTLFGILGLLSAYAACFWGSQPLIAMLESLGFSVILASLIVLPVLFFSVYIGVSFLLPLLIPSVRNKTSGDSPWGALLGGGIGVLTGLIGVWFIEFLLDSRDSFVPAREGVAVTTPKREVGPVSNVAAEFIEVGVKMGAKLLGKNEEQTEIITLLASRPTETIKSAQTFFSSKELKTLINDPSAQRHMVNQDFASLAQLPTFKNMMAQPYATDMQVALGDGSDENSDEFMAEKISMVWRRMHFLKDDQQVRAILSDPEIQKMVQEQNMSALMMNTKIHQLVNIVLDDHPEIENYDFSSFQQTTEQQSVPLIPEKPDRPIYQWVDDEGVSQFTDDTAIPEHKRDQAIRLN